MNTQGIEIRDAVEDMRREPLDFDNPTWAECMADEEVALRLLQDDSNGVPPWMTVDAAIAEAEDRIENLRELA